MGFSTPRLVLRYNGLFDFDGMYAAVIDWAKNYGYRWHEATYKHKVPSPKGAEQEFRWELDKNVTEYISYQIIVTAHIWDLTEVEVAVGPKPRMLSNARIHITLEGNLGTDWQKKFKKPFLKKMKEKWYEGFVFKKDLEGVYGDQLHYRILNLQALMKKFFDMQSKKHIYKKYLGEN